MKFEDQRIWMVDTQLKQRGISDELVLQAFMQIPRELFVTEEWKDFSYRDHPLTIGAGQTISQPFIVAAMLELLKIEPNHSVLEIGTGSGYQTALLACLAKEVYTIERVDELAKRAKVILTKLFKEGILYFRTGDGSRGWEKAYPPKSEFDRIIVAAGAPKVPEPLLEQLAEGGRMVLPVGNRSAQSLLLIEKRNGELTQSVTIPCTFVPLIGEQGWGQ